MKYVLLDLDGTLTNPKIGITKSVQYALKAYNIEVDVDDLLKYIGPPLRVSFKEYHGIAEDQIEEAVAKYREYFSVTGLYENEVYEGIPECLTKLKEAGLTLIVATSKAEPYARTILEHFGLADYFTDICGSNMDGSRGRKEEVIRYAIEKNGITDLNSVVMVGDRLHDIEGAKAVGIASIGVLYGFGSREEFKEYGADWVAESVEDVYEIIVKLT